MIPYDRIEQLDLLQKVCNKKGVDGVVLSVDSDGYFKAIFPDKTEGYYYSFDHAVKSIHNRK